MLRIKESLHTLFLALLALTNFVRSDDVTEPALSPEELEKLNREALEKVTLRIHHNGNPNPCGRAIVGLDDFDAALDTFEGKYSNDKYYIESMLTRLLVTKLDEDGDCSNTDDENPAPGFGGYCDRGEEFTPILLDYNKLVKTQDGRLPCRFFTREGVRITTLIQLADLARESGQSCMASDDPAHCPEGNSDDHPHVDLYAVSAGRVFMFAPRFVGEIFELPHIAVDSGLPVYIEVLNLEPRVFDIFNFFSKDESDALVQRALSETSPTHKIKRSTTGTSENSIFAKRTSENGFDTHGTIALKVKKRCMSVLGFDEYLEGHTDGLQILRYNKTTAYTPHMDYMEDKSGRELHDYDSAHKGGNRFATILLYMSDMGVHDGGETVFSKAWPPSLPESERQSKDDAITALRGSGDASMLKEGSWEEEMVATCRSKLSVRPNSARAVLFYSQHPNGAEDLSSKHGGCPVLRGEKWAANLWAWNTPREGFTGSPVKPHIAAERAKNKPPETNKPKQLKATWTNTGKDPAFKEAELYFDESGYWGKIGHGDAMLTAYTYEGHRWNIKVGDSFVKQFVIGREAVQAFFL